MKKIISAAIAAFILAALIPAHVVRAESDGDVPGKCGVEREAVKVLEDADAASIDFSPRPSSVEELRALNGGEPAIKGIHDADQYAAKRLEDEKHVVRVRAVLVGWKREADKDFHIVIAQPGHPNETMIAEPPDPTCSTSPKAVDFAAVRAAFVKCFGEPARWKKLPPMTVDLDGVQYFDPIHGQTGVAPNGIELHPLLKIVTVKGHCTE